MFKEQVYLALSLQMGLDLDVWVITLGGVRLKGRLANILSRPETGSSGPAAPGSVPGTPIMPARLGQVRALSGTGGIPDPLQCLCGFP